MYSPQVEIGPDGECILRHLPPIYVEALLCLPQILEDDDEAVHERLFPVSYPEDADKEAEWERLGRPELKALFASRTEIIRDDLQNLALEPVFQGFRLDIPSNHRAAWMAGLNAARLALGVLHEVGAEDMEEELDLEDPTDRQLGLLKIHLLGYLQGLIVDAEE
jgi:hypothetical protein